MLYCRKNREEYPVILAKDYGALLVFAQSFNILWIIISSVINFYKLIKIFNLYLAC